MVAILVIGLFYSVKAYASENVEPRISIYEDYSYQCFYNLTTGYVETLRHHRIMLQAQDLISDESHNLTLVTEGVKISGIDLYSEGAGSYENVSVEGKESVTALFNGSWCELLVRFDNSENSADPLNMLVVPYDSDVFSLDSDGNLFFGLWLNTSSCLDDVYIGIRSISMDSPSITKFTVNTNLNYEILSSIRDPQLRLLNVSKGDHFLQFKVQYNGLKGDFNVDARVTQKDTYTVQTACFLDGQIIFPSRFLNFDYSTGELAFLQSVMPWVYAYDDPESYCLNFTAPRKFILRIDRTSREQVDFLLINSQIKNVSIELSSYYDDPCYQIALELESDSNIILGLTLRNKKWFLRPTIMKLEDIPTTIIETFTDPSSSFDGQFIDVNDPFVQSWANQVIQNESNPYFIAYSLYENLTTSLQYNKTFSNEYASATLRYRQGVCRHFARAYAALCIVTDLPVRTVLGTAFSFLNETWKKNHEWNEVYFPQYGWVTVDPTWEEFGMLSNKHAFGTYWTYFEGTLNITKPSSELLATAKNQSQITLKALIDLCRTRITNSRARVTGDYEALLDQAEVLGKNGYLHEALLKISEAYASLVQVPGEPIPTFQIVTVLLLITTVVLVFHVVKLRRRIAHAKRDSSQSSLQR